MVNKKLIFNVIYILFIIVIFILWTLLIGNINLFDNFKFKEAAWYTQVAYSTWLILIISIGYALGYVLVKLYYKLKLKIFK